MGHTCRAICRECCRKFAANVGGGFFFIQVRCEACGKTKQVPFEERGEAGRIRAEGFGKCRCGGDLSEGARVRCPFCRSEDVDLGEPEVYYD